MANYAWLYQGTDFGSALNWTDGTHVPALAPPGPLRPGAGPGGGLPGVGAGQGER